MKKIIKRITIFAMVGVMAFAMTACGDSSTSSSTTAATTKVDTTMATTKADTITTTADENTAMMTTAAVEATTVAK